MLSLLFKESVKGTSTYVRSAEERHRWMASIKDEGTFIYNGVPVVDTALDKLPV